MKKIKHKNDYLLSECMRQKRPITLTIKNRFIDRSYRMENKSAFLKSMMLGMHMLDKKYKMDSDGVTYSVVVQKITPEYVYVTGHKIFKGLSKFKKTSIKKVET